MPFGNGFEKAVDTGSGESCIEAAIQLLEYLRSWLTCNSSDPTVQALSDQIEFDRPLLPGPFIQSIRKTTS